MATRAMPTASSRGGPAAGSRNETEFERYDRNLNELLSELRVALPGVQVLFGFLLVVPFNQRFASVSAFERDVYLATLLLTLLSCILLVAPTIVHRLHFGLGEKAYVVRVGNRLMLSGLMTLATAMTLAILLVTHYLFGAAASVATTAAVVVALALVWFALPLRNARARRRRWAVDPGRRRARDDAGGATSADSHT